MYRHAIKIFFFLLIATCTYSQDYVIKTNGDTIFGHVTMHLSTWGSSGSVELVTRARKEYKFGIDSACKAHCDGFDYEVKLVSPHKPKRNRKDFMKIVLTDSISTICCYYYNATKIRYTSTTIRSTPTTTHYSSRPTGVQSRAIFRYYLFQGDKFIDYFKKKNARELLMKYFKNCSLVYQKAVTRKKVTVYKLHELITDGCN